MGNIVVTLIILSLFLLFVFTFIRKVHEQKNYQRKLLEQLAHKEALRKKERYFYNLNLVLVLIKVLLLRPKRIVNLTILFPTFVGYLPR